MKQIYPILIFFCLLITASCSFKNEESKRIKIKFKAQPFALNQVQLLDGPFKHATELDEKTLLNYNPDRFLAMFRTEAGLKPKADHYAGWEEETIAGHSLGHYLSACSQMYQTTGKIEFLNRVNYMVDELEICQKAKGTGYIGASPKADKIFEDEIAKGKIRSKGFDLNGIWAPLYTQHKELAGLLDAYTLTGNKKALTIATAFADWIDQTLSPLTDEQLQDVMHCEFGGINESFAELFSLTGNTKYLKLAQRLFHKDVMGPISEGHDILAGQHANTQIPKFIGTARLYELTGNEKDRQTAKFFWERVAHHHSYVTGGNCNHEYFGQPDSLRDHLSQNTTESCNVYNMLKLTSHLFEWEPTAEYADFYERALFNHILSSQHPASGEVIYNLSLDMGGMKIYEQPETFTCCVGTGMETHSKYSGNIFYHNKNELFVFQFIASKLNWKEKGLIITQQTKFPEEQGTTLQFECEKPTQLSLQIRYPYWAKQGIEIKVNGQPEAIDQKAGSFITLSHKWETGDKVKILFPFSLRSEPMPDDSNRLALMYGPLVLAGDLGAEDDSLAYDPMYVPVIMSESNNPENWVSPVAGQVNTFQTIKVGYPRDIVFKPFYQTHNRRYSVYFDLFSKDRWEKHQADYQNNIAEKKKLEARTIDFFQPGEMQPERDHNFTIDKGWIEYLRDRKGRIAERGGQFSFTMKVQNNKPINLWVEFWGGYTGSKTFDILVEDRVIATENISDKAPGKFIELEYQVPTELTQGKNKITVTFKPHDGHRAGPLFGIRTLNRI